MAAILFIFDLWIVLVLLFIAGLAVANVFSILFSLALQRMPDRANEVSGLMIMGIAGSAVILPVMGVISDHVGQIGGLLVLLAPMVYLFISAFSMQKVSE